MLDLEVVWGRFWVVFWLILDAFWELFGGKCIPQDEIRGAKANSKQWWIWGLVGVDFLIFFSNSWSILASARALCDLFFPAFFSFSLVSLAFPCVLSFSLAFSCFLSACSLALSFEWFATRSLTLPCFPLLSIAFPRLSLVLPCAKSSLKKSHFPFTC